jgi:hypothetical protein
MNILNGWKNYFCTVHDARQTEVHTAEPLVTEPSTLEFQIQYCLRSIKLLIL